MRTIAALLVILVGSVTGCAGAQTPRHTVYACPSGAVVPSDENGAALMVGQRRAVLAGSDGAGDRYVLVHGDQVREYVLPRDDREDALVWDASDRSRVLVERCIASGGHTDILTRWLEGETLAEIGDAFGIDDQNEVNRRLRRAIIWMNRTSRRGPLPARTVPTVARLAGHPSAR